MTIKPVTKAIPAEHSFYARFGSPIIIFLLLTSPLVMWGAMKAAQSNNNNIRQWLPRDLPEAATYEDFRRHFGADEFAIVSWDGCSLEDIRLEHFADLIIKYDTGYSASQPRTFFKVLSDRMDSLITGMPPDTTARAERLFSEVNTGPRLLADLLDAPFPQKLTREEALGRLEGIFVGKDRQTTCAIVKLTDAGNRDRVATMHAIYNATDRIGIPRERVHIGGEVVFNAVIDIESHAAIDRLTILSALAAVAIAFLSLRSVRLTLMVFVTAVYAAGFAYAMVHYTGGEANLVLVIMPVLVYVMAMSGSIHVTNYYNNAARAGGVRGAVGRALAAGWVPCVLSATTTATGLFALVVSYVEPVKRFGQYGALGVMAILLFLFLLLPVLLLRYPPRNLALTKGSTAAPGTAVPAHPASGRAWVRRLAQSILLRRGRWLTGFGMAMVLGAIGIIWTQTSVKTSRFFPADHPLVTDMHWLELHIGPLVPIEIVLDFDNRTNHLTMLERMELVHGVLMRLADMPHIGGTISPCTWAPSIEPPPPAVAPPATVLHPFRALQPKIAPLRREIVNSALKRNTAYFVKQHYLSTRVEPGQANPLERWRITARFEAFNEQAYDEVIKQVEGRVAAHLATLPAAARAGVSPVFTGAVPLVHAAQQELLRGLFASFLLAFAIIGLTVAVLLRSLPAALVLMLPNILPALIIFGAMGWLGFVVDVGAMLTASVAMGIAVDSTLHYLNWFQLALKAGATKDEAIVDAFTRCSGALVQTTAITALSLMVFFFTSFQPVAQFGLLMCLMLVAALIGDLFLLPAVMGTRIGKVFMPKAKAPQPAPRPEALAS